MSWDLTRVSQWYRTIAQLRIVRPVQPRPRTKLIFSRPDFITKYRHPVREFVDNAETIFRYEVVHGLGRAGPWQT